jgi:HPt (histidine-containing phosphotransfer) domain-containing protein
VAQAEQLDALAAALQDADWRRAAQAAHAVAGQAAVVGARDVADRARALQTTLEGGAAPNANAVALLLEAWRDAERELLREAER